MLISNYVAKVFKSNGIHKVFLYPGGTIAPLIHSLLEEGISIEVFKSEQGAGYAAIAAAQLTKRPQVVMVTSGPGVTNVISCLADAYYDSVPIILITGQISTKELTTRLSVRQRGFQETPTVALTRPISKRSSCLMCKEEVFREVPLALQIASEPREGPVILDFPMDVQRTEISDEFKNFTQTSNILNSETSVSKKKEIKKIPPDLVIKIKSARRPVIMLGHGALSAAAFDQYAILAERLNALVVTSFRGIGSYDTEDRRSLGYIGHTGHLAANRAVHECDFLLVLGARLDVRQTGTRVEDFVPNGDVAWINSDITELANPRVNVRWAIQEDVARFCEALLSYLEVDSNQEVDVTWQNSLREIKAKGYEDRLDTRGIAPRDILSIMRRLIGNTRPIITTGVGCHQHWAARHLAFGPNRATLLSSAGHGTMGFDLPAAIGAAMTLPNRQALCIVGDGSFLMNIQELATAREKNLNIKILVMNNQRLGIVSQFQLITWDKDPATGHFYTPDFAAVARGFGFWGVRVDKRTELDRNLDMFWNSAGPALIEILIDNQADVTPMLLAGQNMGEMWLGRCS